MSGSRRTYDTESLIIRDVKAYSVNNSPISSLRVLTADGTGGTFWAIPSALGAYSAFNKVIADNTPVLADLSYNTLVLSTTQGIGSSVNPLTKQITLFNKGFTTFDISGGNTLVGYSNQIVTPTVKFVGTNGIRISGDQLTNTLYIQGQTASISTGIYGYSQINVISNASTLSMNAIANSNNSFLTATSVSSVLKVIGVGDILLTTNATSNAYFISISSFTSRGYLDISGRTYGLYPSSLSTVSTLFYDIPKVGTATSSLLNLISNVSVGIRQQFNYDEQYLMNNYVLIGEPINAPSINVVSFYASTMTSYSNVTSNVIAYSGNFSNLTTNTFNVQGSFQMSSLHLLNGGSYDSISLSTGFLLVNGLPASTSVMTPQLVSTTKGLGNYYLSSIAGNITLSTVYTQFGVQSNGVYLTSDRNVKENISSANLSLCYNNVKNLPLRHFKYISSYAQGKIDHTQVGFIAQEVSTIFPKSLITIYDKVLSTPIYHMNFDQIFLSHYGTTQVLMSTVEGQESRLIQLETLHHQQESTIQGLVSCYQHFFSSPSP